jgi:UDP-glucose 4-epimerase
MTEFDYSPMQGKEVLITGGLGFIGSSIAHRCVRLGAGVTVMDACLEPYGWNEFNISGIEKEITLIKGDVRNAALMKRLVSGKHIVFHMAAQVGREISMENPSLDAEINCLGTLNCLEAARHQDEKPKIVFAGSRGQTGEPVTLPVTEDHPDHPTDIYGINKLAAEKYCFLYGKVYDIPVTSLRLNNVYGPRCQMHANFYGILNWFMSLAMKGEPIPVYGEGLQTRDYIYIDDIVDAFIRASLADATNGCMYYVGSGKETVFLDMVKEVIRAVGKGEIRFVPFPESREKIDIKRFVVSTEKLYTAVEWKAARSLREGVDATFRYYEQHIERYLDR